jgi:hypothetical protein
MEQFPAFGSRDSLVARPRPFSGPALVIVGRKGLHDKLRLLSVSAFIHSNRIEVYVCTSFATIST